jgi:peptide/nickel transport system permease protein
MSIFGSILAPQDVYATNLNQQFKPPSAEHWFGTDELGRDTFSRVLYGAKYSLQVGITVITLSGSIGITVGLVAGWYGGKVDEIIMRITDVFMAVPGIILAIAIVSAIGPSLQNVMIGLAITWWPWYARLVRSLVLSLREAAFVEAARSLGASNIRIMRLHLLPNALGPVLVTISLDFGGVIIVAAGLSFIGFGAQPPLPEWGLLIALARTYITTSWWLSFFPGAVLFLSVLGFNLLGDGLRDALDPKLRRQGST